MSSLAPGSRLGPYEVVALLGVGGMGEVYRATDTNLKRQVAIKVLPTSVAADADRLARFQREAEVLAALNHPNIAHIHGLERSDGTIALVMELVEGPTLADRIAQGAIALAEALPIAKQIAEALEAAHEHGIIHRDLKPANIKVRDDGTVKVLDFGLAKAMEPAGASSANAMNSPTISLHATQAGVILGTAAYMAPEQAAGKTVDKRSDLWAFGVVLLEMLTGRQVFGGETVSHVLASVLKDEPDWTTLPATTPAPIRRLLRRCLEKDRKQRLADAADARLEITDALTAPAAELSATGSAEAGHTISRSSRVAWAVAGLLGLALVAAATIAVRHFRETVSADPVQFTIAAPENSRFGGPGGGGTGGATQLAISPDGRHVVFVATKENTFVLWLRSVGTLVERPIAGTEDGSFPFWSPDSRFVGFFAGGKLKKVLVAGGPPIVLCDVPAGRGGTWNADNVIVFSPASAGVLQRVSSAGGAPVPISVLDQTYGETNHRWPHFLPDGRHFLYTAVTGAATAAPKPSLIKIGALDSTEAVTLVQAESSTAYASGYLLYLRDGGLVAHSFDAVARQLKGDPFPIAEQISTEGVRYAAFSASPTGVLVYGHSANGNVGALRWHDRSGKALGTVGDLGSYTSLALSPNERRVAVGLVSGSPANIDVWVVDVARAVSTRLTFDPAMDTNPVWSPDGSRIAFQSLRAIQPGLRVTLASGSATDASLLTFAPPVAQLISTDWSRDGRFIAYSQLSATAARFDVWILPLSGDRKPFAFAQTPLSGEQAAFAPDSRWIAYVSNESGQNQVYVQPFPPTGGKYQISRSGGIQPMWRGDGKELYFLASDGTMMAVAIDTKHQFEAGIPQALFQSGITGASQHQYAVTRDGKRFLVIGRPQRTSAMPLTVVVNWLAAVQK